MADHILQEYSGFDHNDVDADSRSGSLATAVCSIVDDPAPPYGTYCLKIAQSKTLAFFLPGDLYTYANFCHKEAYVYLDSTNFPPPAANPIAALLGCRDETGTFFWYIRVDDAGDFELFDGANNLLDTYNNLSTNTWYRIGVNYEPGDVAGRWEWWIEEAGEFIVSRGEGDEGVFTAGGGSKHSMYYGGQGGDPLGGPLFVCHGGAWLMSDSGLGNAYPGYDAGKTGDFLAVYTDGNITLASIIPDCDENGVAGAGDNTTGLWNLAGDGNLATLCSYFAPVRTSKGGAVKVAAPVSRRTDYLYAAKWIWRYAAGLASYRRGVYGIYDPTADQYNVDVTDDLPLSGAARYARKIVDWPNELGDHAPTYDGQAVIGFTVAGTDFAPGTMSFYEGYFSTLEAIPLVRPKPSIGHFTEVWRNKKGRPL